MSDLSIGYVNVFVSDIASAVAFFRDTLGLTANMSDEAFGYASFQAGPISFGIAQTEDAALLGRHTGVGFVVQDRGMLARAERGRAVLAERNEIARNR
jgi:catechol 2,3-dioxygenase-like lactoylglutathione lyase family enzyme